jgi:hypothetical protein
VLKFLYTICPSVFPLTNPKGPAELIIEGHSAFLANRAHEGKGVWDGTEILIAGIR